MSSIQEKKYILKSLDEVTIRTAGKKDAEPIITIMNTVIGESKYTLAEPGEYGATKKTEEAKILAFKKAPGKLIIVSEIENKITGFLEYSNWQLRRTAHNGMLSMFILKGYRNKGIGKLLLQNLIEWAESNPIIEKIALAVFANNERAIALYNKSGFEIEGNCPKDMKMEDGTYIDSILMYKIVK